MQEILQENTQNLSLVNDKVIVALDFSSKDEVFAFLNKFQNSKNKITFVKVGMELFYAEGPTLIQELKSKGYKIFLDLKLHDIPNTVSKSIINIAKLGADITNIHASGGYNMMAKAAEAIREAAPNTKLIAVSILTSIDQTALNEELNISGNLESAVTNLALLAHKAKLDGMVCSALEAKAIKSQVSQNLITVCPGIRLSDGQNIKNQGDQKRVMTPITAIQNGADYLVMGRAITQAKNPTVVFDEIIESIKGL